MPINFHYTHSNFQIMIFSMINNRTKSLFKRSLKFGQIIIFITLRKVLNLKFTGEFLAKGSRNTSTLYVTQLSLL